MALFSLLIMSWVMFALTVAVLFPVPAMMKWIIGGCTEAHYGIHLTRYVVDLESVFCSTEENGSHIRENMYIYIIVSYRLVSLNLLLEPSNDGVFLPVKHLSGSRSGPNI